ncbi:S100P-binding protein [Paroedura picta]|uniref:S100P-binding protein n=1 Tax=Paroedura picta TaxID=143630 RepID=UPI0040571E5E
MASRYFRSCHSGLYHEVKVTILNDLVSRSKRPFDDFQEGEQVLQPEVKKQRCSSPFLSSPSDRIAGSQVYDDSDLDATLLEYDDGESPDSPFWGTLEDEDRLLADDTSDGFSVEGVGSGFAEASLQITLHQNVPPAPRVSAEPLPPNGLSVPSSSDLPHSCAPANPGEGSHADVDSQSQTGLSWSPGGLQDAGSIEAGFFSLQKEVSGSGIADKEAARTVEEETPAVSQLMAECESASVATDRPSEEQAFVQQCGVVGESTAGPPCETQGESYSAAEVATEHPIAAPNKDHVEDPGTEEPENPSPKEPEDLSPDDSRRRLICISEEELWRSKKKYVEDVLAHAKNSSIIGPVNELHELMNKVASEYHFPEPSYRHPTDLTVRNYAHRTNGEIKKCSLEKWVDRNLRHFPRFAGIPDKFERSPIPSR